MKKILLTTPLLPLLIQTLMQTAHGAETVATPQDLGSFFESQLSQLSSTPEPDPEWELDKWTLRIEPRVGFGISSVVELTISPELELVFTR